MTFKITLRINPRMTNCLGLQMTSNHWHRSNRSCYIITEHSEPLDWGRSGVRCSRYWWKLFSVHVNIANLSNYFRYPTDRAGHNGHNGKVDTRGRGEDLRYYSQQYLNHQSDSKYNSYRWLQFLLCVKHELFNCRCRYAALKLDSGPIWHNQ